MVITNNKRPASSPITAIEATLTDTLGGWTFVTIDHHAIYLASLSGFPVICAMGHSEPYANDDS